MPVDDCRHERFAGDIDPLKAARSCDATNRIDLRNAAILYDDRGVLDRWAAVTWNDASAGQQQSGRLRRWRSHTGQGQRGGHD
jgi:hypothetical protein